MIERVTTGETLLAIIVRKDVKSEGVSFVTAPEDSMQLGLMGHKAGHEISPHIHRKVDRKVQETHETLVIRRGRLRVDFYNDSETYLESKELVEGDIILLCGGGHGFKAMSDVDMVEVKQGPFVGNRDKDRF